MPDRALKPLLDKIAAVLESKNPSEFAEAVQELRSTYQDYRKDCHDIFCVKKPAQKGS